MKTSTTLHVTTYDQLLHRLIADGIAEVRKTYDDPKEHHKRDGAIEGFEACRGKTPSELVTLWAEAERCSAQIARERRETSSGKPLDYWRQRYKTLQIEWICDVVSVDLTINGQAALLAYLPTWRAALKYAEIVGVRGSEEARS